MSPVSARPAVKRQYGSRKPALNSSSSTSTSSPSSSASTGSASSSTSQGLPRIRSSVGAANWAELLEEEDSSTAADSSTDSSFSATSPDSPPTSPDTSLTKSTDAESVEEDVTEMPSSSGSSSRILRKRAAPAPGKATNLLSFFKPASPHKRASFASSDSEGSDSESELPASQRQRKRKQRQEATRPTKRLALTGQTKDPAARPKLEQLFLDPYETAGHSHLSCAVCNLSYARTPEDLALHDKHHKRVVGGCDWPASIDSKAITVLEDSVDWGTSTGGKILMVDAVAQGILGRKVGGRIADVLSTIDTELDATSLSPSQLADCKLFLFVSPQHKVIACAVVQRIESAFQVLPATTATSSPSSAPPSSPSSLLQFGEPSSAVFCSPTLHPTLLGVQRIWTSATHRRHGLAARLLDHAAKRFIYGCPVERATGVAFSQPTGAGMKLARRWTGTDCFRVFVD
ncbi:hypothetical protein RQP46_003223 [Phenoliferia psychrophenolica]